MLVSGSFALEAWTKWPDFVTVGIMLLIAFFLPPVALILGVIGLIGYVPWW
jgi:hypothetical protein